VDQQSALEILLSGQSAFVTGAPGTGKSTVLREFGKKSPRVVAVTASTGIAATQVMGTTLHSFAGLGARSELTRSEFAALSRDSRVARRFRRIETLVIDEVSMIGPELLETVDALARHFRHLDAPFGGLQIVLGGDMFQLPPVKSREGALVFDSPSWRDLDPTCCYLEESFRQRGGELSLILAAMRTGTLQDDQVELLRSRVGAEVKGEVTRLFTHNVDVDKINAARLEEIASPVRHFKAVESGPPALSSALARSVLAPADLILKEGAWVMSCANDPAGRFVNGSLGRVLDLSGSVPLVELRNGSMKVKMEPFSFVREGEDGLRAEYVQIPLRLAWAITVHKSQGMTLDAVRIDLSRAFAYGMGYVALSRARTLEAISLDGINDRALMLDPRVFEFDESLRRASRRVESSWNREQESKERSMDDRAI